MTTPENGLLTEARLTEILARNGYIEQGEVLLLTSVRSNTTYLSDFYALQVDYAPGSAGALPSKMLMKRIQPEWFHAGVNELYFYRLAREARGSLPLATCYGSAKSDQEKQCFLLLEDLRDTHPAHEPGLTPPPDQCRQGVSALSRIHARWWNDPRFAEPPFQVTEESVRSQVRDSESFFPAFVDAVGARLSSERKDTYERIFERVADLSLHRLHASEARTLVHGDAHLGNFLFPSDEVAHECVVIDWQLWAIGLGAWDLAYMMALQWYPDRREELETALLEVYLRELQAQDVDYRWDDLLTDYRVGAMRNLLLPVRLHSRLPEHIWGPHIERGFAAFDDLGCAELL